MKPVPLFSATCWIDSLTTDMSDNIYYTTRDGGVWVYTKNQTVHLAQVPRRTSFNGGIVITEKKELFLCHTYENTLLKFNINMKTLEVIKDELTFPRALCSSKEGWLLVAERRCIQRIPDNMESPRGDLCNPIAIVLKNSEILFVCERFQNQIKVVNCSRVPYDNGFLPFCFDHPRGLCLDQDGNLLVIDRVGIRRVNLARKQLGTLPIGPSHCIAVDRQHQIIFSFQEKVFVLHPWLITRLLWIGNIKNGPEQCPFARLPSEIIVAIANLVKKQFAWINHK